MLLMPVMFGCSKDNKTEKQIVGDWFMCYLKMSDSSEDFYVEDTYTRETSNTFVSFYDDGALTITNLDLEGLQHVSNGTWSIEDGNLMIMYSSEDGNTYSETYSISFENDNLLYLTLSEGSYSATNKFQRM